MQDQLTVIRIHASREFKAWLGGMLVDNPNGLGSELVTSLKGSDNAARADALLEAATRLGWIERTTYAPSDEQRFLGVGGFSTLRTDDGRAFPRVAWSDDPKTEPACQAPVDKPPRCRDAGSKGALRHCSCPRIPYRARAVSPSAIRKAAR